MRSVRCGTSPGLPPLRTGELSRPPLRHHMKWHPVLVLQISGVHVLRLSGLYGLRAFQLYSLVHTWSLLPCLPILLLLMQ